jgi:hypothetical protein
VYVCSILAVHSPSQASMSWTAANHAAGGGVEVVGLVGEVVAVGGDLSGQGTPESVEVVAAGVEVVLDRGPVRAPRVVGVGHVRLPSVGSSHVRHPIGRRRAVGGLMRAKQGFVSLQREARREGPWSAGDGESVAQLCVASVA